MKDGREKKSERWKGKGKEKMGGGKGKGAKGKAKEARGKGKGTRGKGKGGWECLKKLRGTLKLTFLVNQNAPFYY